MRAKTIVVFCLALVCLLAPAAEAQPDKPYKSWFGHAALGYSAPQGDFGDVAKDGWHIEGGATYRPRSWPVGIFGELGYSQNDIERSILDAFEVSGGDVSSTSLTTGLIWSPRLESDFGFYLLGGVGGTYVSGKFTEPVLVGGIICDPYFWWICYPGYIPGQRVVASASTTKFSYSAGFGLTWELRGLSQIYLETRYRSVSTREVTDSVTVSAGFRW